MPRVTMCLTINWCVSPTNSKRRSVINFSRPSHLCRSIRNFKKRKRKWARSLKVLRFSLISIKKSFIRIRTAYSRIMTLSSRLRIKPWRSLRIRSICSLVEKLRPTKTWWRRLTCRSMQPVQSIIKSIWFNQSILNLKVRKSRSRLLKILKSFLRLTQNHRRLRVALQINNLKFLSLLSELRTWLRHRKKFKSILRRKSARHWKLSMRRRINLSKPRRMPILLVWRLRRFLHSRRRNTKSERKLNVLKLPRLRSKKKKSENKRWKKKWRKKYSKNSMKNFKKRLKLREKKLKKLWKKQKIEPKSLKRRESKHLLNLKRELKPKQRSLRKLKLRLKLRLPSRIRLNFRRRKRLRSLKSRNKLLKRNLS